jgi:hypothetical protein
VPQEIDVALAQPQRGENVVQGSENAIVCPFPVLAAVKLGRCSEDLRIKWLCCAAQGPYNASGETRPRDDAFPLSYRAQDAWDNGWFFEKY